jgi:hypothetical protein
MDWRNYEETRSEGWSQWSAISAVQEDICRCLVEIASSVRNETMNVGEGKQTTVTLPFLSLLFFSCPQSSSLFLGGLCVVGVDFIKSS